MYCTLLSNWQKQLCIFMINMASISFYLRHLFSAHCGFVAFGRSKGFNCAVKAHLLTCIAPHQLPRHWSMKQTEACTKMSQLQFFSFLSLLLYWVWCSWAPYYLCLDPEVSVERWQRGFLILKMKIIEVVTKGEARVQTIKYTRHARVGWDIKSKTFQNIWKSFQQFHSLDEHRCLKRRLCLKPGLS